MSERFVFVPEDGCIWDRVGKRKYFMSDMLADCMNHCWNQTLRFEKYCQKYQKQLGNDES